MDTQIINQRQWYEHLERIERQNIQRHHYSTRATDMLAPDLVITNSGDGIMRVKQGWKDELEKRFLMPVTTHSPQGENILIRRSEWDNALYYLWNVKSRQTPKHQRSNQEHWREAARSLLPIQAGSIILRHYGPLLEVPVDWWQRLCELYDIPADTKPLMTSPVVICLCGSTRFPEAYRKATFDETLAGRIVLSIGCNLKTDSQWLAGMDTDAMEAVKQRLDDLHLRKIDMADGILVINVGGYIGESTRGEIAYAIRSEKSVRYLEPEHAPTVRELTAVGVS